MSEIADSMNKARNELTHKPLPDIVQAALKEAGLLTEHLQALAIKHNLMAEELSDILADLSMLTVLVVCVRDHVERRDL